MQVSRKLKTGKAFMDSQDNIDVFIGSDYYWDIYNYRRGCSWRGQIGSLRTADACPVVASLPPKNSVCEPVRQNDFCDVKPF